MNVTLEYLSKNFPKTFITLLRYTGSSCPLYLVMTKEKDCKMLVF